MSPLETPPVPLVEQPSVAEAAVGGAAGITAEDEGGGAEPSTEELAIARELVRSARSRGVAMTGPGGMLKALTKPVIETALDEEMTEHLGYDRHDPTGRGSGNSRNGTRSKAVLTDKVGPVQIEVPRDRDGSFDQAIVMMRQRRLGGVDIHPERQALLQPACNKVLAMGVARSGSAGRTLAGIVTVVALLNVIGWGVLLAVVAPREFRLGDTGFGIGVGVTAFLLGARHAFDADHIAIIDNATRKLVGEGRPTLGTGFWFALGHSSVVFALSLLLALGVRALAGPVQNQDSALQHSFGVVGTLAAGMFLIVIGLMNLSALLGLVHAARHLRAGTFDDDALEHHLHNRGFLARIFKSTTQRVSKPWHLYPVGLLMGLGFDTATQVALLVLAGGTAAYTLPWYAILVLPVLFAAGMTLFDTIDGLFMARAYQWAFLRPARKLFYNITVTALSVLVALSIGVIVLVQLLAVEFSVPALDWVASINLQYVGFVLVAVFVLVWAGSLGAFEVLERRRGSTGR